MNEFLKLVKSYRNAQLRYLKSRSGVDFQNMKHLERVLDKEIEVQERLGKIKNATV